PLRVFLRAEEQDTTSTNDEGGVVELITTAAQNFSPGVHTDWFQERTSANFDDLDGDCGIPNAPCLNVTYAIVDDPFPAPPPITVSASPHVLLNGKTWVNAQSDIALTATAPNGQSGD